MDYLTRASIWKNIGALALALVLLAGGTWTAAQVAAEHLLYKHATSTAESWARFLTESITDLEQIAAGQAPSGASMAMFESARRSGLVFRYEVFNRAGYSQLVSDRVKVASVELSDFSRDAADSIRTRSPVVDAKKGTTPSFPSYYAQAYVPVIGNDGPSAVVAAYVDLSNQRDQFYQVFLLEAAAPGSGCSADRRSFIFAPRHLESRPCRRCCSVQSPE